MGSFVEINDTLQLTSEQGFPAVLELNKHFSQPFTVADFAGQVFDFTNKPSIRIYHRPPVRVFLVHNIEGKRLYRWLVEVLSVVHDYCAQTTSWSFRLLHIYTPEEMMLSHALIDRNPLTAYDFSSFL